MGLVNNGKHAMLNALGALATKMSLHTGDPGASGTSNEHPASNGYSRQTIAWSAAADGAMDLTAGPTFSVGAVTITHFGLWSAGGTFYGSGELPTPQTYASPGTYAVSDADITLT